MTWLYDTPGIDPVPVAFGVGIGIGIIIGIVISDIRRRGRG